MNKKNLKKLLSAVIAAATLLTSTAFAAMPAKMIVDVPTEIIDSVEIPVDDTDSMAALVSALNGGIDEEGNEIPKSNDIYGWNIMYRDPSAEATVTTGGVQFGTNSGTKGCIRISNGEMLSCFADPFQLKLNNTFLGGGYSVFIGKVKSFGDAEDDYYKIGISMSYSAPQGTHVQITRTKTGETTVNGDRTLSGGWTTFNGYLDFDGEKLTVIKSDGTEVTSFTPPSLVKEGKIYINVEGNSAIKFRSVSLEKPSSKKANNDFYVALEDLTAEEITMSALSEAGWTASAEPTYAAPYFNIGVAGSIAYEDAKFSGDYAFKTVITYWNGSTDYRFNYVDDKNYYNLNITYNYKTTLSKYVNGTKITLATADALASGYGSLKTVLVKLTNTDDALTIDVVSPQALTYVDYADDTNETVASGEPLRGGSVRLKALGDGSAAKQISSFKIYPNTETAPTLNDITFDMYVDDVKVEGTTASKGAVSLAMPTKYAGRLNKVIVALYDNYEMQQVKLFDAIDFARADKIEVFDTTNCSSDAQIGVFMWNTLTNIKPLIQETIIDID